MVGYARHRMVVGDADRRVYDREQGAMSITVSVRWWRWVLGVFVNIPKCRIAVHPLPFLRIEFNWAPTGSADR